MFLSWLSLCLCPVENPVGVSAVDSGGFAGLYTGIHPVISVILIGIVLGATFPVIISYIGTGYKSLSGTAIGIAMVIALSGNTLLNYLMGFLPIRVFPLYLLIIWAAMTLLYLFMSLKGKIENVKK